MTNARSSALEVFQLRSRVLRTVYYDGASKKMVVEMTQGKIRIYRNVAAELVSLLVNHPAPGVLYEQQLKSALKPRLCSMTMSNMLLLRQVRKISRSAVGHKPTLSTL
jgi:hypothetical protein